LEKLCYKNVLKLSHTETAQVSAGCAGPLPFFILIDIEHLHLLRGYGIVI
jgi:hypothetical protein